MKGKLDWLSFTLECADYPRTIAEAYTIARNSIRTHERKHGNVGLEQAIYDGQPFDNAPGRAPYRYSVQREDHGVTAFVGSHTNTVLFEISGRGTRNFGDYDSQRRVVGGVIDRITRLDYAIDIPGPTRPSEFANQRNHNKFRSVSFISSDTGETVYVGSPKSDRFCRVYRYHHPHPRSNLLRVEFVYRRKLAKQAAIHFCQSENPANFAAANGNTYGFEHQVWDVNATCDDVIETPRISRSDENTILWLYKQVAPAMRRLLNETDFNMTEFLEYVYNDVS